MPRMKSLLLEIGYRNLVKELRALAKKHGAEMEVVSTKNHPSLECMDDDFKVSIPKHSNKDIRLGTERAIRRDVETHLKEKHPLAESEECATLRRRILEGSMTIDAMATFVDGGWEIEFPKGVPGLSAAYTCTFDPDNTKAAAKNQVKDLVSAHHVPRVRYNNVYVNMLWRNEDGYRKWYRRYVRNRQR